MSLDLTKLTATTATQFATYLSEWSRDIIISSPCQVTIHRKNNNWEDKSVLLHARRLPDHFLKSRITSCHLPLQIDENTRLVSSSWSEPTRRSMLQRRKRGRFADLQRRKKRTWTCRNWLKSREQHASLFSSSSGTIAQEKNSIIYWINI